MTYHPSSIIHHLSSNNRHPSSIIHHPSSNRRFTFAKLFLICIIVVSLILFIYPLFKPGLIAGHDTGARFVHVQMMAQALKDGEFPVRWVEGPSIGLSHPLFNYYPPLFYYPPAILTLLGVGLVPAVYITLALFVGIGWLGMYIFVKKLTGFFPAVISAALFLFTPYRISQIYVRAAYMEFAATSIIPFAFWGILAIFQKQKITGLITTTVSLALIITLHQPTFIMVLPALLAWIGYLWIVNYSHKEKLILRIKGLISFLAIVIALFLAASFVLPLVGESQLVRPVGLSGGYFDFRQHFATILQLVYSPWGYGISQPGPNDGMSFQVGVLNWLVLVIAIGLIIWRRFYKKGLIVFFALIALYGMFMSISASLPIWERLSILFYIQYPWRYLAITSFATAVLAGIVFYQLIKLFDSSRKNWLWGIVFIFVVVIFNWQYLAPAAYLPSDSFTFGSSRFPRTDPLLGLESTYFPVQVAQINSNPSIPRFKLIQGKAKVKTLTDKTTFQEFSAQVTSVATIQINTHYFPGWQAKIDNGKEISSVTPGYNNAEGNMEITLPPGSYKVSLQFTNTPIRRLANYLSLGTIIGLVILIFFPYNRFKKIWQTIKK